MKEYRIRVSQRQVEILRKSLNLYIELEIGKYDIIKSTSFFKKMNDFLNGRFLELFSKLDIEIKRFLDVKITDKFIVQDVREAYVMREELSGKKMRLADRKEINANESFIFFKEGNKIGKQDNN